MDSKTKKALECIQKEEICLWRIERDKSYTYENCHKCNGLNQCELYQGIKLEYINENRNN